MVKVQKMNYAIGIPKGLRVVLEEQGIDTSGMNGDKMREVLGSHPDFKDCNMDILLTSSQNITAS